MCNAKTTWAWRSVVAVALAVSSTGCGAATGGAPAKTTRAEEPTASIVFLEDDFERAVTLAKESGRPIFVDAWAPWCHSCLSMREYVFREPKVVTHAKDFVWLAIDTEKDKNAPFVKSHAMEALPTLWVLDPKTGEAAMRWTGSATADELSELLDDARLAVSRGDAGGDAAMAYLRGNRATAAGQLDLAIESYRTALAKAPPDWAKRPRVIEALSGRLVAKKDYRADVELATVELSRMPVGTHKKSLAYDALHSLVELPEADRGGRVDGVLTAAEALARDSSGRILADDRSDLYEEIVTTLDALGRKDEARRIAGAWAEMLEAEAANAKTPAARAVFDPHRVSAYLTLGTPEKAVPMLSQSEKEFPDDYNPPARLAAVLRAQHKYPEALAAVERALAKSYGPRSLRFFLLKADILADMGDRPGEKAAIESALERAKGLTLTGSAKKLRETLEERARKLP